MLLSEIPNLERETVGPKVGYRSLWIYCNLADDRVQGISMLFSKVSKFNLLMIL